MLRHLTSAARGRVGGDRRPSALRRLALTAMAVTTAAAATLVPAVPAQAAAFEVLVFSKTAGFRHDSISVGIQAIRDLGSANDFTVDATEDSSAFNSSNLSQYKAVVFLSTTGDVLNDTQQSAFQSYVDGGGGHVGVHAAADTEYNWSYYGTAGGRLVQQPPRDPAGHRPATRTGPTPRPPTWGRPGRVPTSGTATAATPARTCASCRTWTRAPTAAAAWATTPSPGATRSPNGRSFLHRPRPHPGVLRRLQLPHAAAGRDQVRGQGGQRRLPPRDRLHRALQRLDDGLAAGRTGLVLQQLGHADLLGRHGHVVVQHQAVRVLLAQARLAAERRLQLRRHRRLPRHRAPPRPRSTPATRSRSTRPTARTRRRARSTASRRRTSPPATRP